MFITFGLAAKNKRRGPKAYPVLLHFSARVARCMLRTTENRRLDFDRHIIMTASSGDLDSQLRDVGTRRLLRHFHRRSVGRAPLLLHRSQPRGTHYTALHA